MTKPINEHTIVSEIVKDHTFALLYWFCDFAGLGIAEKEMMQLIHDAVKD